ncbi:MAG TPA: DUF5069 domain-containing protein [Chthoniobacterales bacterium]
MSTKSFPARSPSEKVGGLVYFGRMLDKIGAHVRGELPPEYVEKLGGGFDGRCVRFLGLDYADVVARVKAGGSDEEIWQWAREVGRGRSLTEEDISNWNEFMRKCGWNDEVTPTLEWRKEQSGMKDRADIATMFQFIDTDEQRL